MLMTWRWGPGGRMVERIPEMGKMGEERFVRVATLTCLLDI